MDNQIDEILGESVVLEKKVGVLYRLLGDLFPEDGAFWFKLADEEDYHSVIMHSAKDHFFEEGLFPALALDPDVENIRKIINEIDVTIAEYKLDPPTKTRALERSLELEMSSGEYYMRFALNLPFSNPALDLLRELVGDNKDHAGRIEEMMKKSRG